jgi:hypothetical protein
MTSSEIKIDKNVPMPQEAARAKYPWKQMEIGDSFFVPANGKSTRYRRNCLQSNAHGQVPRKFAVRLEEGGVRVWRVE